MEIIDKEDNEDQEDNEDNEDKENNEEKEDKEDKEDNEDNEDKENNEDTEDKEDKEDNEDNEEQEIQQEKKLEEEQITCKNNIIDSTNNIDSNDLTKLCKIIESLENGHHIEIAKILKTNNVYLNENSNGIFVNLNKISLSVYKTICNYIEFIKKQENDINKDEKLKRNLQTTYFKDNKDIATTNISN